jgi:multidrug efflux pump subunit AcrA (membrane-fusion protein)
MTSTGSAEYLQSDKCTVHVQDEMVVHNEQVQMLRQARHKKARQQQESARAKAQEEKERAEAAARAEAAERANKKRAHEEARLEAALQAQEEREQARQGQESARAKAQEEKQASAEKLRAERLAAKEAAAAEALRTQVVPSWVVDKMLKIAEPGDHIDAGNKPEEGPRLPLLLDDALQEIHNDFLVEKEAVKKKLASMGLDDAESIEVEEDEAVTDAKAKLSQSELVGHPGGADEVDEEESLVPVPPSPEPPPLGAVREHIQGIAGVDSSEIIEELAVPGDGSGNELDSA